MSDKIGFYNRLFQFCMQTGTTADSLPSDRNPEDLQWLKQFLDEAVVSPIEIVKACISALEREAITDEEKELRQQAIVTMNEWLEDIDVTRDFIKSGKLSIIEQLLNDEQPNIRLEACRLVCCVAQNYEDAQKILCDETNVMAVLSDIVRADSCVDHKAKAISALRCMVENNAQFIDRFLAEPYNGYDLLILAIRSNHRDLQGKAAMFINTIIDSKRDELINRDFVPILQQAYAHRPWHYCKYLMLKCLHELIKDNPGLIKSCKENGLQTQIRSMIGSIPDEEDSTSDTEVADEVLALLDKR